MDKLDNLRISLFVSIFIFLALRIQGPTSSFDVIRQELIKIAESVNKTQQQSSFINNFTIRIPLEEELSSGQMYLLLSYIKELSNKYSIKFSYFLSHTDLQEIEEIWQQFDFRDFGLGSSIELGLNPTSQAMLEVSLKGF